MGVNYTLPGSRSVVSEPYLMHLDRNLHGLCRCWQSIISQKVSLLRHPCYDHVHVRVDMNCLQCFLFERLYTFISGFSNSIINLSVYLTDNKLCPFVPTQRNSRLLCHNKNYLSTKVLTDLSEIAEHFVKVAL